MLTPTSVDDVDDDHVDDHIDAEIGECLDLDAPKSFFLFAGAGSGKTRSLVNTLIKLRRENGKRLQLRGQRIAVITYTNAACDEIISRLEHDSLFVVSTIHSFVWDLIKNFQKDIKEWLRNNLKEQIAELLEQQQKGRSGKAAMDREKSIESKNKRIQNLENIKRFTYNPNGDNRGRDSLSHSEVINLGAYFLAEKILMQKILINKFPILLIDESQDTKKELMNAFLIVQTNYENEFSLGLFGDTMQRIYNDGKIDLGQNLPLTWAKPAKIMNHRCPPRIVRLINRIRSAVDQQEQKARSDKPEGIVHMFIFPTDANKKSAENTVSERMATITEDSMWCGSEANYKALILEHHMAANRMGFLDMFAPLYQIEAFRTGLLDGTLPGLRLFTQLVLPIIKAKENDDQFAIARVVRNHSPLLSKKTMQAMQNQQLEQLQTAKDSVRQLFSLWNDSKEPRMIDVLQCIAKTKLFDIPDGLHPIAFRNADEQKLADTSEVIATDQLDEKEENSIDAWDKCLNAPFSQVNAYYSYVMDQSSFATHQGVKGLEFPRVMVIIDDNEARGFLFNYDKLFGAKEKSPADFKNEHDGKDTSIERTRRLFYVTCSRAEKSLAIVAYSSEPEKIKNHVVAEAWFEENEVELMTDFKKMSPNEPDIR